MKNIINPIDHYNQTETVSALKVFLSKNKIVRKINDSDYGCQINKDDPLVTQFHQNNIYLEVVAENPLNLPVGTKLSPFEIRRIYSFKGNYYKTLSHVMEKYNFESESEYIRVG